LLTDLEVSDLEEIAWIWHWCDGRWTVEEDQKALKTGCAVEALPLTTAERLQPVLALLSVVAVALVQLRDAGRTAEAAVRPATELFSEESVAVLAVWRFGTPRTDLTMAEFSLALGRLGAIRIAVTMDGRGCWCSGVVGRNSRRCFGVRRRLAS
jgi:hypothetical protein